MMTETVCVLSGKGGAGKTVIALAMARILSEAGLRCLLVDCDIATHGATYFFEAELKKTYVSSLADLMGIDPATPNVLETQFGFSFLPSTLSPETDDIPDQQSVELGFKRLRSVLANYDACIFDCHAGFSKVVFEAAGLSDKNLIVLEPDAISAAALRILYLQLARKINSSNTWQMFNKLTEEERPIYEKIAGGTLFANLPPIPFDWNVRAAFSVREVPGVTSESSAFGLGVLRIMKTLFPGARTSLAALEERSVGTWYASITKIIADLEKQKRSAGEKASAYNRRVIRQQARVVTTVITAAGIAIMFFALTGYTLNDLIAPGSKLSTILVTTVGALMAVLANLYYRSQSERLRHEASVEDQRKSLVEIDSEIARYRTLILTDPMLRERAKQQAAVEAAAKLDVTVKSNNE